MTYGQIKAYEVYWEASDALEEAGVPVEPGSLVEEIVRCMATEVGDLMDAFTVLSDE
jgi:hypothetical protein